MIVDTNRDAPSRYSNPFATCWTNKLDYIEGNQGIDDLVNAWELSNYWGAIVGPHGTGKTTLLSAIGQRLESQNWNCLWLEVRNDNYEAILESTKSLRVGQTAFLLEGFERLSLAKQSWLLMKLQVRRCRVLATLHSPRSFIPFRLKNLQNTEVSKDLVRVLFSRLMNNECKQLVFWEDALECWQHGNGNLRDLWFELYELHESRSKHCRLPHEQRTKRVRIVAG